MFRWITCWAARTGGIWPPEMDRPARKPNRLTGYDYRQPGCYFVTICTKGKRHLFWNESPPSMGVGADIIRPWMERLSPVGLLVEQAIREIPVHYPNVIVENHVVMPNHVHILLSIEGGGGRIISAPTTALSTIVGQMKRAVAKRAGFPIWQKGYHDHIVRGDADHLRVWKYIDTNPAKWREDCYFTETEE